MLMETNERIVGIYSVMNLLNNKIYIGQSIDIERRWNQHRYGKGNIILRNAIKKHGIENFTFNILETINSENKSKSQITKELTLLEQKWFDMEQPFLKENGYNIQKISKPNLTPNKNSNFGEKISKIKIDNNHTGKNIKQYDLNGNFIREWKSAAEVERMTGFRAENISASCLRKSKSSNNFIWRFIDDVVTPQEVEERRNRIKPITRKVKQVAIDGKIVKIWGSFKELVNNSNFDYRPVKECCNGNRTHYKGYFWSFEE